MFAVVVTLTVDPADMQQFMPLMLENAKASKSQEVGCVQFDVCTDAARPGEVFLYETYHDAAAFADHLQSPHFNAFDAATAEMVQAKDVRSFAEVIS